MVERPPEELVDRTHVERARAGDLGSFEEIVRERIDAVYRISLAILGNEADAADATQETFLAAWRQLRGLRDAERFEAWLQRIAVNSARMVHRSRRRRAVREIPVTLEQASGEGEVGWGDADRLRRALGRLGPDQRAILALHHLEGRSVAEIAEALAIPMGTVKSRLFQARRALAEALTREER
jgi:RNA polymerase sigma-70 factor (ECF subfamily)